MINLGCIFTFIAPTVPKHLLRRSDSSPARKRDALIRSPSKVSKRASATDAKLHTPEKRASERRRRHVLEDTSNDDDDSAKRSDENSNTDCTKVPVDHDGADGANALPLTSHMATVAGAGSAPADSAPAAQIAARKSASGDAA